MSQATEPTADEPARPEAISYATGGCGYERWREVGKRPNRIRVCVHRLLAVAEYGFDAVAEEGTIVAHKNAIPWDNRPANIDVVDEREYCKQIKQIPRELLLEDLRIGAEALGRPPRIRDVKAYGAFSYNTYRNRFGGLKPALREAGIIDGGES